MGIVDQKLKGFIAYLFFKNVTYKFYKVKTLICSNYEKHSAYFSIIVDKRYY